MGTTRFDFEIVTVIKKRMEAHGNLDSSNPAIIIVVRQLGRLSVYSQPVMAASYCYAALLC
jgi:hypothetical protein